MARVKKNIGIGERYRALHPFGRVWEVDDIYMDGLHRAHAQMHAVEMPSEHRTIAVDVLLDRTRYAPVE
ncbi:MAG TPA: hypothetical protein VFO41_03865 [Alphaproteobacteria bacterium]|nr:hypothetical protein [Alphaproteobacteria bacterium]